MSNSIQNQFIFLHEDEGNEIIFRFNGIYTQHVIEQFINFMRACDYCDETIYETMSGFVEKYYSSKERKRLGLPVQQDDLEEVE